MGRSTSLYEGIDSSVGAGMKPEAGACLMSPIVELHSHRPAAVTRRLREARLRSAMLCALSAAVSPR